MPVEKRARGVARSRARMPLLILRLGGQGDALAVGGFGLGLDGAESSRARHAEFPSLIFLCPRNPTPSLAAIL